MIEDGLTIEGKPLHDVYEAVGHAKAYDFLHQLATHKTLEEKDILELHRLFYQQIDNDAAGKYRSIAVFISGSKYPVSPPQKVANDMKKFVAWFNKQESKLHPVEFAALTHKKIVFIHPFIDGNGRLARLLMNLALLRNEYTIAIIPAVLRHEYIESLELVHKDDGIFKAFIVDRLIDTQMDLLRLLNIGGVNSLDLLILRIIQATPGLNAPALSIELNKSLRTMKRYLKKLVDAGKIEFIGAAKNGGYFFKMEK